MVEEASVEVLADAAAVAAAAARRVVEAAAEAIGARGRFSVALSGGSTPKALYELLASDECARRVDWTRTHVFFGDERCVPPTDPRSNERLARLSLLDRLPLPAQNVHPMRCADDPPGAAATYERELRAFFTGGGAGTRSIGVASAQDAKARADAPERVVGTFDLVLLGLGANGHTASLFPGLSAVRERQRWVVAEHVAEVGQWRVTLTPPAINAAGTIVFVVTGGDKAAAVRRVIEGRRDVDVTPAQAIAPQVGCRLVWLLDAAAAAELGRQART
jgi:6-phosphogluconolactonase